MNPRVVNPKKGYIVSANQPASGIGSETMIGISVPMTMRAIRITDMIESYIANGTKFDKKIVRRIVMDDSDVAALRISKIFVSSLEDTTLVQNYPISTDDV